MAWTDERLDDAFARIDRNFDRMFEELRATRVELGGRIDALGERLDARLDKQQRQLTHFSWWIALVMMGQVLAILMTRA